MRLTDKFTGVLIYPLFKGSKSINCGLTDIFNMGMVFFFYICLLIYFVKGG
jgi:hypothetical protein